MLMVTLWLGVFCLVEQLRIKNDLIKDQKSMLDRSGSALRQAEAGVDELRRSLRELELHNQRLGTDLEAAERVQQETQRDHEQLHSRYEELCDVHGELKARAKHLTRTYKHTVPYALALPPPSHYRSPTPLPLTHTAHDTAHVSSSPLSLPRTHDHR